MQNQNSNRFSREEDIEDNGTFDTTTTLIKAINHLARKQIKITTGGTKKSENRSDLVISFSNNEWHRKSAQMMAKMEAEYQHVLNFLFGQWIYFITLRSQVLRRPHQSPTGLLDHGQGQ